MLLLLVVALLSVAHARLVNVTIDDTTGDARTGLLPQYIPTGNWDRGTDPGALNGTSHFRNSDLPGNISMRFTGSRIYAYFGFWPANVVDLSFFMNGEFAGQYTRGPGGGPGPIDWVYGEMAFGSDQLPLAEDTLLVVSPGGEATTLQFDYAIYTTEDSDTGDGDHSSGTASNSMSTPTAPRATRSRHSSTRTSSSPLSASTDGRTPSSTASTSIKQKPTTSATRVTQTRGAAIGAAVGGGAAFLLVVSCGALLIWKRRRHRSADALRPFYAWRSPQSTEDAVAADKRRFWSAMLGEEHAKPGNETTGPAVVAPGAACGAHADSRALRAQLEHVCAENERQLGEIALLKRAAAPPPYSDRGRRDW